MRVTCEHCALPFTVARAAPGRAVYCCSGCALAARVPVDAQGQFPVNAALGAALGLAFAGFNQVLFWLLAVLLARDPEAAVNATRFGWASLGLGAGLWLAVALVQWWVGARRPADIAVLVLSGAGLALALASNAPAHAAVANLVLGGWALRGLRRKRPETTGG